MDNERALRLFVSVVEENSISRGGARLNIPQSSASRMIAALERNLGAKLLQRSTRSLHLTEAGDLYFERARKIVTDFDEAASAVRNISGAPSGLLRVAAPASFGRRYIAPYLPEFSTLYPKIEFGLSLSDSIEDLIGHGFDVALRLGDLPDSNLISSRVAGSISIVCASPAYLSASNDLSNPRHLQSHNCLLFRGNLGKNNWSFQNGDTKEAIQVGGSFYCNNGDAILASAIAGLGVALLPEWMVQEHLETGQLRSVLSNFRLSPPVSPIQAVFSHRQHIPAKTRVFVSFLRDKIAAQAWVRK